MKEPVATLGSKLCTIIKTHLMEKGLTPSLTLSTDIVRNCAPVGLSCDNSCSWAATSVKCISLWCAMCTWYADVFMTHESVTMRRRPGMPEINKGYIMLGVVNLFRWWDYPKICQTNWVPPAQVLSTLLSFSKKQHALSVLFSGSFKLKTM